MGIEREGWTSVFYKTLYSRILKGSISKGFDVVCRGLGLNLHYTRGESIDVSVVVESIFGGGNSNSLEIQINKELKVILDSFAAKINKSKGQTE